MPRTKTIANKITSDKDDKNVTKSPKKQENHILVQHKKISKVKKTSEKSKIKPTRKRKNSYDLQDTIQGVFQEVFNEKCGDFEFQTDAIKSIQESTEKYLNDLWEDAKTCAKRSGREKVTEKDIELAKRMLD